MRSSTLSLVLPLVGVVLALTTIDGQDRAGAPKPGAPPLLQDYTLFTVTAPPPALGLDPFYKKFVDAHGIPVATSAKGARRREADPRLYELVRQVIPYPDAGQRLRRESASATCEEVTEAHQCS